jgi:hypothetical protein
VLSRDCVGLRRPLEFNVSRVHGRIKSEGPQQATRNVEITNPECQSTRNRFHCGEACHLATYSSHARTALWLHHIDTCMSMCCTTYIRVKFEAGNSSDTQWRRRADDHRQPNARVGYLFAWTCRWYTKPPSFILPLYALLLAIRSFRYFVHSHTICTWATHASCTSDIRRVCVCTRHRSAKFNLRQFSVKPLTTPVCMLSATGVVRFALIG